MDTLQEDTEGCYYNRSVKFFYEASGKNISDHWRRRDYVIVSLGMIVCFVVIFSNLLVIGAIFKNRRFHFPIYYLLGNLAVADLFAGVVGRMLFVRNHSVNFEILLFKPACGGRNLF